MAGWLCLVPGRARFCLVAGALVILATGCAEGTSPPTARPPDTVGAPAPIPATSQPLGVVTINSSAHPQLGTILTDAGGRTVYLSTNDERNNSNCSGGCAETWPPVTSTADPEGGEGVSAGRLDTIIREDGSVQITYNGWPLYHYARDEAPGEANGQDIDGTWFVVSTAGGPIQGNAVVANSKHSDFGTILVDASGRTLYLFTADEKNKSVCSGGCAIAWPPLLSVGDPAAAGDVEGRLLSTLILEDGYTQVAYNGWPLYYYAPDQRPGDAKGQNVGDIWFVVSIMGGPIQSEAIVKTSEHPALGTILTDDGRWTLYLFTEDEPNKSNCPAGCATGWPPLLTFGGPRAGEHVSQELLGTLTRDDGYTQVTYNGSPLYYFAPDEKAGDATGQGSADLWYVLSNEGEAITSRPPAAALVLPTATPAPAETLAPSPVTPSPPASSPTAPSTSDAGRPSTVQVVPTAVTPVPATIPTPSPPAPSIGDVSRPSGVQEVATIEDYFASRFFPQRVVVIKDIPVSLFVTRLHREHVNQFSIRPFLESRAFIAPGTLGLEKLTPDQSGEFSMVNEGHGFDGDFIVVDTLEDAKNLAAERGSQEFSLIHDLEGGRIVPSVIFVQVGIPVKIYNTSLKGEDRVSIAPLFESEGMNVRRGEITTFRFTPEVAGVFTIRYDNSPATGTLVVEE